MLAILFIIFLFSGFLIFLIPNKIKYYFTLFVLSSSLILTSFWSYLAFININQTIEIRLTNYLNISSPVLYIDLLSAFFILIINFTSLTGLLYGGGYLKPYYNHKKPIAFSIHYFSYIWLYFSMLLVVMLRDGFAFLIVWELMSLSSFLLVIFNAEDDNILKVGINYLIQMHIGLTFILIAFLIVEQSSGEMSFFALNKYFSSHSNLLLFVLFFIGFGLKAGFIPLHTWLPEAHPAAPSHVSGVMSGVMIKLGIYGIMRVLVSVQNDLHLIGMIILIVSLISGLLGVMSAIIQHDIKRLLAYHSIENIGIIGIGIGLGVIGTSYGNQTLALLGYSGGLLHVLNHSLFKSLLFFGAGSVYKVTHTLKIDQLGGLIKKMPYTAIFFLIGSLAICGLPPLNGFISEYLIYLGMFKCLSGADLYGSILIIFSITGLTLIGGLAIFCFTKAFSIIFLGQARTVNIENIKETEKSMLLPQIMIIIMILAIGLGSPFFIQTIFRITVQSFHLPDPVQTAGSSISGLQMISILGGLFVVLATVLLLWRKSHMQKHSVTYGPTWGCGYTAGNNKQQYTASSYADNFIHLARPLLGNKKHMKIINEEDIFPKKRQYESHSFDVFRKYLFESPIFLVESVLKKIAIMQTGQIQHYILYAFMFILAVFLLTFFKII